MIRTHPQQTNTCLRVRISICFLSGPEPKNTTTCAIARAMSSLPLRNPRWTYGRLQPSLFPPCLVRKAQAHAGPHHATPLHRVGQHGCPPRSRRAVQTHIQAARQTPTTAMRRLRRHASPCMSKKRRARCSGGRIAMCDNRAWARRTWRTLHDPLSFCTCARTASYVCIQRLQADMPDAHRNNQPTALQCIGTATQHLRRRPSCDAV